MTRVTDEERARRRAVMKAAAERARARSAETDRIVDERAAECLMTVLAEILAGWSEAEIAAEHPELPPRAARAVFFWAARRLGDWRPEGGAASSPTHEDVIVALLELARLLAEDDG